MNNKEMIIFIGIQASGKTTFYHKQFAQYEYVSLDILHTRNKERIAIEEAFSLGKSMVIDNTNPTVANREGYIRKAKENGYHVAGYFFNRASAIAWNGTKKEKERQRFQEPRLRRLPINWSCQVMRKALMNCTLCIWRMGRCL